MQVQMTIKTHHLQILPVLEMLMKLYKHYMALSHVLVL